MANKTNFTIIIFTILAMTYSCSEASGSGAFKLVLSGSVHGQLDHVDEKNPLGGLSRKYVKIQEMIKQGSDPLIVDAGDLFSALKSWNLGIKNQRSLGPNQYSMDIIKLVMTS